MDQARNADAISRGTYLRHLPEQSSLALLLSPFFYLLVYAIFLWAGRALAGQRVPFRTLLLSFGFC